MMAFQIQQSTEKCSILIFLINERQSCDIKIQLVFISLVLILIQIIKAFAENISFQLKI